MSEENKSQESTGTELQSVPAQLLPANMPPSIIGANGPALTDILLDNIKKVQENKDYIPQAQAVSDNIGQIIQLAKTQIEMFKVVNSMQQPNK